LGDSYISRDSISDNEDDDNGLEESFLSDGQMTSSMIEERYEEGDEEDDEGGNNTNEIFPKVPSPRRDIDAEAITGMKGLSLEREESEDTKV